MSLTKELHWHEGLFIQPHHFQILQRNINSAFIDSRRLTNAFAFGLIECDIDVNRLENEISNIEMFAISNEWRR